MSSAAAAAAVATEPGPEPEPASALASEGIEQAVYELKALFCAALDARALELKQMAQPLPLHTADFATQLQAMVASVPLPQPPRTHTPSLTVT